MELIKFNEDQCTLIPRVMKLLSEISDAKVAIIFENDKGEVSLLQHEDFLDQRLIEILQTMNTAPAHTTHSVTVDAHDRVAFSPFN